MSETSDRPQRRRNPRGQGSRLREDIVDAAADLIAHGNPPGTLSLRAVAREAGITAPAIYRHFTGIDEVLAAVVDRRFVAFSAFLDAAEAAAAPGSAPRDILALRALAYCRYGLERPGDYDLLFGRAESSTGVPYANSAGEQAFRDLVDRVARARPDVDPVPISSLLWPALHGVVLARGDLPEFPWPALEDQVAALVDALVTRAPAADGR